MLMNSKMLMIFEKGEKPFSKIMSIIVGHFMDFELTHIIFELGHLNFINILNAPNILKSLEGLWINSVSAHIHVQNLIK